MKVAIVNSSPDVADILRRVLVSVRRTSVAWVAYDGEEAVRRCNADRPDLVLIDLGLPKLDGIAATRQIMAESPCAVLIVAAGVSANVSKVYDAMSAGALDAVDTPFMTADGQIEGGAKLLEKVSTIRRLIGEASSLSERSIRVTTADKLPALVALGASTGGPQALATVIESLPAELDAAVVIVQHFDRLYAQGFVDWLGPRSKLPVQLVNEGTGPRRGVVMIGATNDHLIMDNTRALSYTPHPRAKAYRPSVDVFFESLAKYWPRPAIAVLLTGMGKDGATGLLQLRRAGWLTIAQDEKTSVVYGMPRAAAELGAAMKVLPVAEIGPAISARVSRRRP